MEVRGWIVHATWRLRRGEPVVVLHGRLEDGRAFRVEDDRTRPHFFATAEDAARLADEPEARIRETALRDLRGRPVVRVEAPLPAAATRLRERLREAGPEPLEADLPLPARLLVDRGLRVDVAIRGPAEPEPGTPGPRRRFANPELAPTEAEVALRTLSLDLETTPDASRILAGALVGCGVEEVHLLAGRPVAGAVTHDRERALLEALLARVAALDPDVLLGWNVVDFDLRVLARRCEALGLRCALGREGDPPRLLQGGFGGRGARAELSGRVVLDGIPLARDALRLPDFRLETVARAVLGRGKRIDNSARNKAAEILRMHREDPEALAAYNLEDARLVPEILAREGLLALAVERSRLSGMPLDRVGASVASFDRLYLPELRRRGFVAPSVRADRPPTPVRGGALLEPRPGLWRAVAVYDFQSLYPSLMRTFQLDPLAHARAGEDAVVAPGGARFAREGAILPEILERLAERRAAARARGDRHADQAIKIMMNALFGVLGTPGCRFFDPALANAITGFGQAVLGWTRDAFEAQGVEVLYGDTDSVFVKLPEHEPEPAQRLRAEALRAQAEAAVHARIRADHRLEPHLALRLERVFERLWLPRLRGGTGGSKKRYAGRVEGRLVTVGLESVRRDWPEVARRLQLGLLERLFADGELGPFVREVVTAVREGRLDAELVFAKRLRKGSVDRYTKSTPPHIRAARKAGIREGRLVRYVVTRRGPEPVRRGEPLPPDIDRGHYVERVLRPVAEAILAEVGLHFDDLVGRPRQLELL